uniref:Coenzyme F420 hydrogenase beta subunit n=1 Tax=Uncultured archaeon GZfos26G2 TaxID=3386331 RepID=Q648I9_UNCAG|nr:coenzyme F420 hydrogenase beta subunit [uncultured archaeon GZfos37D1]
MEEKRDFGDLEREVIEKGKCALCGGCVATCRLLDYSYLSVDFSEERPVIRGGQQCPPDCGYCYYQCPRVEKPELKAGLEEMYEVASTDAEIRKACQDGGAVTSLLAYALDEAIVEGCITVADKGEWKPEVQVARDKAGLIKSAGSKYTPAATLTGIADAILDYDLQSVTLVGTPCGMASYEKMFVVGKDTHNAHNFSSHIKLRIGLFCMGTYSYEKLIKEYLEHAHGVNINEVTKLQISEDVLHLYAGDKELLRAGISEIADYKRDGCTVCEDFAGLFSDISVGNNGTPEGKSSVIVRTDFGKKVFEGALERDYIEAKPINKSGADLIHRLMKAKKEAGIAEKERRMKKQK